MPNEAMRETWTTMADDWVTNEVVLDGLFAPVTSAILSAAAIEAGHRVLDVGCGTGTLLAAATDAGASATGVDISPVMVEAAARRVPSAHALAADVQTGDLAGLPAAPFDRVVSRFGVMFFDDPVAAFANVRAVTAPGGSLTFACWRDRDLNPMFTLGTSVLVEQIAPADSGGPGPTSFQDPDHVAAVLSDAGWSAVSADPVDFVCDYGADGADGVETRLAVVLGTTTGMRARAELEPTLGADGWAALLDEVRAALRAAQGSAPTLAHPAAVWLVTASR